MSFKLLNRTFTTGLNGLVKPFAHGNSGTFINEKIKVGLSFIFLSSVDNAVIINSSNSLKLSGDTWDNQPFLVGDSVQIVFDAVNLISGATIAVDATRTITDIDDDLIFFDTEIPGLSFFTGILLPSLGSGTACKITNLSRSTVEEFFLNYNWIENDNSFSLNSIVDGSVNSFRAVGIQSMGIGSVVNFVQIADKSGINFDSAAVTRLADVGVDKIYEISIITFLPDFNEDLDEPDWFVGDNCLKSVFKLNALPYEGDPNNNMVINGSELEGNNGWLNEEYNGNESEFTLDAVEIKANDGTVMSAIDHTQKNTIEIDVTCVNEAEHVALKVEIIPPTSDYKENEYTLLQNTLSSTYRSTTGTYKEYIKDGMFSEISNASHTFSGASANVVFDIEFNADAIAYLDSLSEQLVRITATFISYSGSGGVLNNEATILVWQGQTEPQPLVNLPYDEVESAVFHAHNKQLSDAGTLTYTGCTEDDILYNSKFKIKKSDNSIFEKFISRVIVKKVSDDTNFTLIQRSYNFDSFVTVGDVTYFNIEDEINQYLDGPDRDIYSLKTLSDDATHYLVELNWSFFADWRYWVSLPAAFPEFYDLALPQNGQSHEWMRYLREVGYEIYFENILVTSEDQAFNWQSEINLQDYEFNLVDPPINTVIRFYNEAGDEVDNLISGEIMRVEATHTSVAGIYYDKGAFAWLKIRNKEGTPSKWISTIWDLQARNEPWQPLSGFDKAKITYPAANIAVVEALLDTNLLTGENFTVVARIYSGDTTQLADEHNVNLRDVTSIKLPEFANREDRGLDFCGKPFKVLADVSDSATWKNDVTGLAFKLDSIDIFLEKDGVEVPAIGYAVDFPYQDDAVGFVIDWRQHQVGGKLSTGCYKLKVYYEIGGLEGFFYYGAYQLLNYSIASSEGDCRIYAILDDYVRDSGINYRDSGFRNSVRFNGMFGWMQPNYDIENIIKTNRTREKVRVEALRTYKLEASYALNCITNKIDFSHLLAASHIFVSDYNKYNHEDYRDFPVILDEESTPEYSYSSKLPYAKIITTFIDKKALWESKFSGKSGINQPKFGLEPISIGGGDCAPADVTLNGDEFATVESGGTLPITVEYETSGDNPIQSVVGSNIIIVDPVVCPTPLIYLRPEPTGILTTTYDWDDAYMVINEIDPYTPPLVGIPMQVQLKKKWLLKNADNEFGHRFVITGLSGGYYDPELGNYYNVAGSIITRSEAFPSDYYINHSTRLGGLLIPSDALNWEDAIDWCSDLVAAGFDDYFMPNKNEMLTIMNRDYFYPIGSGGTSNIPFDEAITDNKWTSTIPSPSRATQAHVYNAPGAGGYIPKTNPTRVMPFRYHI